LYVDVFRSWVFRSRTEQENANAKRQRKTQNGERQRKTQNGKRKTDPRDGLVHPLEHHRRRELDDEAAPAVVIGDERNALDAIDRHLLHIPDAKSPGIGTSMTVGMREGILPSAGRS
jgi:hypothetical protein